MPEIACLRSVCVLSSLSYLLPAAATPLALLALLSFKTCLHGRGQPALDTPALIWLLLYARNIDGKRLSKETSVRLPPRAKLGRIQALFFWLSASDRHGDTSHR